MEIVSTVHVASESCHESFCGGGRGHNMAHLSPG